MSKDFDSAAWAHSHSQLSDAIAAFFNKAAYAFERFNAIQYDAPWKRAHR